MTTNFPKTAGPNNHRQGATALWFALALASAGACVTVNVNFPEATVQNATDDYVRDLYRAKEKGRTTPAAPDAPAKPTSLHQMLRGLDALQGLMIAQAQAAEAIFKTQSDKARALGSQLAAQVGQVIEKKRSGVLGENNDGMLTLDHPGTQAMKPLMLKAIQPTVDKENELRKQLYEEVLSINGMSKSRLKDIQKSFSHSFQNESPSGSWLQDADGKWSQKP